MTGTTTPTHKLVYTLTAVDPDSGRGLRARIDSDTEITLLLVDDDEEVARVVINADKGPELIALDPNLRMPEDAGKCLQDCARGCNGNTLCIAGCALECATIMI